MTLRNLLVHVADDDRNEARVAAACTLARQHNATATGLYVKPYPVIVPVAPIGGSVPVVEGLIEVYEKACAEAKERFLAAAEREGVHAVWHEDDGDAADRIAFHACYSDLVMVGQWSSDDVPDRLPRDLGGLVALTCGRPAMVLPYAGALNVSFKRVMLCWNGSRESTRAAHDMMEVFGDRVHVDVVCVDPDESVGRDPGADIAQHLAAHGLDVDAHRMTSGDLSVADTIISASADLGSDLIVMGAYGHARVREIAFGGMTRSVLSHMPVPVLLSH